jgi:hypothetical protein
VENRHTWSPTKTIPNKSKHLQSKFPTKRNTNMMSQYSGSTTDTDSTTNIDTTEGSDLGHDLSHDWYYSSREQYERLFSEMEVLRDMVETAGVSHSDVDSQEELDATFMWRSSHVVHTLAAIRLRMDQEHCVLHHGSYKDSDKTEFLVRHPLGHVINCPADVSCRVATKSHNAHKHIDKKSESLDGEGLGRVDSRPERVSTLARSDKLKPIAGLQAILREMALHFGYPRFLAAVYSTFILWLMVLFFTCFGDYGTYVMWATILLGIHYLV